MGTQTQCALTPPFVIELAHDVPLFAGSGDLRKTGRRLTVGQKTKVTQVAKRIWAGNEHLAGLVYVELKPYWVLINELGLPRYQAPVTA